VAIIVPMLVAAACSSWELRSSTSSNLPLPTNATPHPGTAEEQAVIIHLRLAGGDFGSDAERKKVFELEDKLIDAIDAEGVGEYDGNEFGEGGVTLYAYGPDADALFAAMEASIREFAPNQGSSATLRYGSADNLAATERVVPLP
jgi:hypothetical protein